MHPQMQATLGLTGLTSNAMALIAPGAFLWLTFFIQATTGSDRAAPCGGASSPPSCSVSQPPSPTLKFPSSIPAPAPATTTRSRPCSRKNNAFKYARIAKFIVGWGSHLYYWVYPGVMVATTGIFVGYVVGFLYPNFISGSNPGPVFMAWSRSVFSFFVAWIAQKGAGASTAVNLAINVIQISALLVFSVLAIGYRVNHPAGAAAFQYDSTSQATYTYQFADQAQGRHRSSAMPSGTPQPAARRSRQAGSVHASAIPTKDSTRQLFLTHTNASLGGLAAQIQLGLHSGHRRHPDPGRIRIGDRHGRRGQKSHQAHTHRGHRIAPHPGTGLLPH